jgi:hypothetical protein
MKAAAQVLSVFVVFPIWFYLLYKILVAVNASEVMWLLYWVYLPVGLLAQVILKLVEKSE